jgi:RNA-binding protein YhbY
MSITVTYFLILFLSAVAFFLTTGFRLSPAQRNLARMTLCLTNKPDGSIKDVSKQLRWSNPIYSEDDLNKWYKSIGKHFIAIGVNGATPKHINNLHELLKSHQRVRIKVATDKIDTREIIEKFTNDEIFQDKLEVLQIRGREFMMGYKPQLPL